MRLVEFSKLAKSGPAINQRFIRSPLSLPLYASVFLSRNGISTVKLLLSRTYVTVRTGASAFRFQIAEDRRSERWTKITMFTTDPLDGATDFWDALHNCFSPRCSSSARRARPLRPLRPEPLLHKHCSYYIN